MKNDLLQPIQMQRNTIVDFVTQLKFKGNYLLEITSIEKSGKGLRIVIASAINRFNRECLYFREISEFRATLFGAPGDTENLPQSLVGLDYWHHPDEIGKYNWELNGDDCTWNWIATLPDREKCL